jgi:hypothetical protein
VIVILICYCRSQVFELSRILEGLLAAFIHCFDLTLYSDDEMFSVYLLQDQDSYYSITFFCTFLDGTYVVAPPPKLIHRPQGDVFHSISTPY